jgi:hypothetical protein
LLRWANSLWLIFTILVVECTLHHNHVHAVVGGPNDNELHLPSQLITLMIGAFGLVRVCYLKLKDWRTLGDRDPSIVETPQTSYPTWKPEMRWSILKIFSPSYAENSHTTADGDKDDENDENEIDDLMKGRAQFMRYSISWLPWLALLLSQHKKLEDIETRSSGNTPLISDRDSWKEQKAQWSMRDGNGFRHLSMESDATLYGESEQSKYGNGMFLISPIR